MARSKDDLKSLSKIFTEGVHFVVPDYQRGYSWGDKQLNDLWEDLDDYEVARDLLTEDFVPECMPREISEIIDEYKEALEELENYNPYRAMCEEVVRKYVNCEADVTDLLQTLDKLARTDEAWKEE